MDKIHLILEPGQRIFLTSDLHFGHNNICKETFANRPWADAKEMGPALIERWNSIVTNDDIVFELGDFAWFDNSRDIKKILDKLNGKEIYCIAGNHDTDKGFSRIVDPRIHILGDEAVVWVDGAIDGVKSKIFEMYLSHCPLMTWPHRANGVPNFFGHIHSGPRVNPENSDADIPLWKGLQYDCGVDNNDYYPIELPRILKKIEWKHKN